MLDFTDAEIEDERAHLLESAPASYDEALESLKERYCSELGYREVLHLSHVLRQNVDEYLINNLAIAFDRKAYAMAWRAWEALSDLYGRLGHLEEETRCEKETEAAPQ